MARKKKGLIPVQCDLTLDRQPLPGEVHAVIEDALELAMSNANPEFVALFRKLAIQTADELDEFTTDDVLDKYYKIPQETRPTTKTLRVIGGIMKDLGAENIIKPTWDMRIRRSRYRSKHGTPVMVWMRSDRDEEHPLLDCRQQQDSLRTEVNELLHQLGRPIKYAMAIG